MGSSIDEPWRMDNEGPRHKGTIAYSFAVGKYPVTQDEWEAVMGNNPSRFKNKPRYPVENIWAGEHQAYIKKLNEMTGAFYRLLSEAEWEYCCRAGTTTTYNTGSTLTTDQANFRGQKKFLGLIRMDSFQYATTPVDQFSPNAFGLYDMHGNVFEWVEDERHNNYIGAPTDGSAWLTESARGLERARVIWGGSWESHSGEVRSAARSPQLSRCAGIFGFRVARTLPYT